jgi:hypothetical protein
MELLEAGITREEIAHRVRIGGLIVELRGVYRVGHRAPSVEARYMAAIKARAAPPPEVTAPTERRVRGVKTHRSRSMDPRDATRWRGIPVTTVPRTLVDLSSELSLEALARFLELLREADLPLPETNRPAAGRLLDCRWPAHRLTVELDGYRYHSSRHA